MKCWKPTNVVYLLRPVIRESNIRIYISMVIKTVKHQEFRIQEPFTAFDYYVTVMNAGTQPT